MTSIELKERTKKFSLRIISLVNHLPNTRVGNALGNQIIRSGTSVGSNYRAVCKARSRADFINKIKVVEEEADETFFWLELIEESKLIKSSKLKNLKSEASELTAIFTSSGKTARYSNKY